MTAGPKDEVVVEAGDLRARKTLPLALVSRSVSPDFDDLEAGHRRAVDAQKIDSTRGARRAPSVRAGVQSAPLT